MVLSWISKSAPSSTAAKHLFKGSSNKGGHHQSHHVRKQQHQVKANQKRELRHIQTKAGGNAATVAAATKRSKGSQVELQQAEAAEGTSSPKFDITSSGMMHPVPGFYGTNSSSPSPPYYHYQPQAQQPQQQLQHPPPAYHSDPSHQYNASPSYHGVPTNQTSATSSSTDPEALPPIDPAKYHYVLATGFCLYFAFRISIELEDYWLKQAASQEEIAVVTTGHGDVKRVRKNHKGPDGEVRADFAREENADNKRKPWGHGGRSAGGGGAVGVNANEVNAAVAATTPSPQATTTTTASSARQEAKR